MREFTKIKITPKQFTKIDRNVEFSIFYDKMIHKGKITWKK